MEEIMQAISTVGFPIVAWLVTFTYMCKNDKMHKQEVDALSESFEKMSMLMESIKTLLQLREEHVDSKRD